MGRENCAGPWPGALVFIPATSPGESATESAPPRENVQLSRFAIKITHTSGVMVGQKGVGIILRGSRGPLNLPLRVGLSRSDLYALAARVHAGVSRLSPHTHTNKETLCFSSINHFRQKEKINKIKTRRSFKIWCQSDLRTHARINKQPLDQHYTSGLLFVSFALCVPFTVTPPLRRPSDRSAY